MGSKLRTVKKLLKGFTVYKSTHETDFNDETYLRQIMDGEVAVKRTKVHQSAREGDLGPSIFIPEVHERLEGSYKM